MIPIEIKIPKEIRDYQESIVFGLSLRQCVFSLLAIGVAVLLYFGLRNFVGDGEIGWICIVAAFPFALGGFFRYNGMNFEQFLTAVIRLELLFPKRLTYKTENLYSSSNCLRTGWKLRSIYFGLPILGAHTWAVHCIGTKQKPLGIVPAMDPGSTKTEGY